MRIETAPDDPPTDVEEADIAVTREAARRRHHPAIRFLGWVSELADQPQLAAICGLTLLTGLAARDPRLAGTGALMLLAHGAATLAKTRIKRAVKRTRPNVAFRERRYEMRPGHSRNGDDHSFPSGHTAGAVAVAAVVCARHPRAAAPAATAALVASLIQVPRGKHYPTDLAAGLAIGLLAASASLALGAAARRR